MNTIKEYKGELLLGVMMLIQALTIFIPSLFPNGFAQLLLLILLVSFIIHKINALDLNLKRKYN